MQQEIQKTMILDLENMIEFGASPRASIWLMRTAKANACLMEEDLSFLKM